MNAGKVLIRQQLHRENGTGPSRPSGLDAAHPSEASRTGQALISFIAPKFSDVFESYAGGVAFVQSFRLRQFVGDMR